SARLDRRSFLALGAAGASALALGAAPEQPKREPTKFQVACMTLPYSAFPLERALKGIRAAGYKYVAWGNAHKEEGGKSVPVMPAEAPPGKAAELAKKCRDMGLEPLLMFAGVSPDSADAVKLLKARVMQASSANVPQVLTFGGGKFAGRKAWVER